MISYPGGLDAPSVFGTPIATDLLTSPDHAQSHTDIAKALGTIEYTVGTTAGTNVLKNFAAGDFPARINASNVLQQRMSGTIDTAILGTPAISAGTWSNAQLIGTAQITGGTHSGGVLANNTIGTPSMSAGTWANAQLIGTAQITGGTHANGVLANNTIGTPSISAGTWANAQLIGTAQITGGTHSGGVLANNTIGTPAITGGTMNSGVFGTPTFTLGSDAQGDIFFRSAGGTINRLAPGTSGHFLKTQGAAADPIWAAASGGGASVSVYQINTLAQQSSSATSYEHLSTGTQTVVLAGTSNVFVYARCNARNQNSGAYAYFRVVYVVGGGTTQIGGESYGIANQERPLNVGGLGTSLAAGTYTFAMQKKVNSNTADYWESSMSIIVIA